MKFSIWKKIISGAKWLWEGIKKIAKALVGDTSMGDVEKGAKTIGAVATASSAIMLVTKNIVDRIALYKNRKNKAKSKKSTNDEWKLDAKGKLKKNGKHKSKKKKKNRAPGPVEEFAAELESRDKFIKNLTPEERKEYKKMLNVMYGKSKMHTSTEALDNAATLVTWDDNQTIAANKYNEAAHYVQMMNEISSLDNPRNPDYDPRDPSISIEEAIEFYEKEVAPVMDARTEVLKIYRKFCIENPQNKMYFRQLPPGEYKKASVLLTAHQEFDLMLSDYLARTSFAPDEDSVNPPLGASDINLRAETSETFSAEVPISMYHSASNPSNTDELPFFRWEGERFVVRNIDQPNLEELPEYYLKDPDENLRNLGNDYVAQDFKSIDTWVLGTPHKYASQIEIDHGYDWSEFEGFRRHPDISTPMDAYTMRTAEWRGKNLQCGRVFTDIYMQNPRIYPWHPDYAQFHREFSESYWDLCRFVPGLGDYGRVFSNPFINVDESNDLIEWYTEKGDCSQIYGANNPPSPSKVFYEILRYGMRQLLSNINTICKKCPELQVEYVHPCSLQDIFYLVVVSDPVVEQELIREEIMYAALDRLQEVYGLSPSDLGFDEEDVIINDGYDSTDKDDLDDGFVCSPDELEDD